MSEEPQTTDPMLFGPDEIPEMALPISEASQEWQDALLLRAAESIRFDPGKLAIYRAAVSVIAPGVDVVEFLDYLIERVGGRSQ
jgi:hypothetical protein